MKKSYWGIFFWFLPFVALFTLWFKFVILFFTLLVQLFVWICQGALKLAGKAIDEVREYKERKQ